MSGNTKSLTRSTDKDLVGVQFHGARLIAVRGETPETTMVAMRPVVEAMGIDWASQFKRLRRHPVLQTCVVKMTMQMPGDDQEREHIFVPLNRLHFWMATISPNHVPDPVVRERVILFQTEAADVLFDHFFGKALDQGRHIEDQTRDLGISKATIKKITALENAVHQMQTQMEAQMRMLSSRGYSPTFDFDDWLTAGDILDIEMIPRGERRALSCRITASLRSYAAVDPEKRRPPRRTPNKMDPQQRWRFHISLVQAWLADAPEGGGGRRRVADDEMRSLRNATSLRRKSTCASVKTISRVPSIGAFGERILLGNFDENQPYGCR